MIGTVLGRRTVRRREWELTLSWSNWTIGTWWGKLGQRHLIGVELGPFVLVGTRRPTHGRRHQPNARPRVPLVDAEKMRAEIERRVVEKFTNARNAAVRCSNAAADPAQRCGDRLCARYGCPHDSTWTGDRP